MRNRDERGLSDSVQWAVLVPLTMLLLLGALQVGMLWHGRNTVHHAAAAAAEAESAYLAAPGTGHQSAVRIAAAGGLTDVAVRVTRGSGRVDVEVSATVPVLIDLGMGRVTQRATSPIEAVL